MLHGQATLAMQAFLALSGLAGMLTALARRK